MNNKAHLRPSDYDKNGDIIPDSVMEEKGDLISRKWLTDAIRNRKTYLSYEDAKDVIDLIDNAPTVEAFTKEDMSGAYNEGYACGSRESKRPQGVWIADTSHCYDDDEDTFECSVCKEPFTLICGTPKDNLYNFCPNCGAKMQKGGAE